MKNKITLLVFLLTTVLYSQKTVNADKILEVSEEQLIRRIADLINIKDIEVLKIKNISKNSINNL